ncbi:aminotransferase, class I/II, partial [Ostertagia ostertagi]
DKDKVCISLQQTPFSMRSVNTIIETTDQIISDGVRRGILHLYTDDNKLTGNQITLKGKNVTNFGSCSYLGLEFDHRLVESSKAAIDNYGTQFSESRAYVSVKLYAELEDLFNKIFEASCVITPTTTLGHIANIPVLMSTADAIITDQLVHNSVNTAVKLLAGAGTHIEVIRHNRMDLLEERIKALRNKHRKVWYLADGIYSMFGDTAPMNDLYQLLDQYPCFHLYIDDAHGMSIHGKNGRGFALDKRMFHPKMVMATSLAKAFATGGAVMVYPDKELARKVRTCGGPLITSGPLQPAQLGAAVAAARIHLSDEIYTMQEELKDRILFTNMMLRKYQLPVIAENNEAVFFVGVHLPKVGYNMVRRMLDAGYYVNLGIFPAVPMKNTGIRFTITRLHTFRQIEEMIATMALQLELALKEEAYPTEEQIDHWYSLYQNVKNNSLDLNTFTLPRQLFKYIAIDPSWEVVSLKLKSNDSEHPATAAVVFCHKSGEHYAPMIIGLDYICNKEYKVYRQALYQLVMRGKALGKKSIRLGFSAQEEKKKRMKLTRGEFCQFSVSARCELLKEFGKRVLKRNFDTRQVTEDIAIDFRCDETRLRAHIALKNDSQYNVTGLGELYLADGQYTILDAPNVSGNGGCRVRIRHGYFLKIIPGYHNSREALSTVY